MFLILETLCLVFMLQTVAFGIACYLQKNAVADAFWGLGIAMIAFYCMNRLEFVILNTQIVAVLTIIWGLRLAWLLGRRHLKKGPEDRRYENMSKNWKNYYLRSYLQVFMLQGLLMIFLSATVITSVVYPSSFNLWLAGIGIAIWTIGFLTEVVADAQLSAFVKTKKPGQIMTTGLWKYSRHPNYFGEVMLWWGIFLIVLPSAHWYLAIITPLTITFLILKVSGIPMAEARYQSNKDFQKYAAKTNAFFPWFPKKD